jgi:hypothetical protein
VGEDGTIRVGRHRRKRGPTARRSPKKKPNFGRTEISAPELLGHSVDHPQPESAIEPLVDPEFAKRATKDCDLNATLAACKRADAKNLFFNWKKKLSKLLPAYRLLLVLCAGGEAALAAALKASNVGPRQRGPQKRNPALLAVLITAKPRDKPQRQQASDYSTVLIWAAANQVDPDNFVEWASATTLDLCLQQVREKRATSKVKVQEAERPAGADANTEPGVADAAPRSQGTRSLLRLSARQRRSCSGVHPPRSIRSRQCLRWQQPLGLTAEFSRRPGPGSSSHSTTRTARHGPLNAGC